ncbi:hypothetical protein CLOBOL_01357 [Enterocloster bolteae ATCC BAA-613]|uniref:Uncharacterized protein n=1 Tax=Enterocloster bolteae (strain ATCC BAA-613 / DSM 15670 / CCUG 46953 / JCM 12243 / WAL 16351) TaxID=411902 RepID=A8RKL3_ENTBW|nr:hypothetical protein CLOBOL_01357 [Enterocloster bolteae ATCC BAA-613]
MTKIIQNSYRKRHVNMRGRRNINVEQIETISGNHSGFYGF